MAISANNPLLNPGKPLSGNALLQAAQGLVNAQTQGPLADLAKQIANNNAQTQAATKATGGYFNQLGQQAQAGANQSGQIADHLNSTLGGIAGGTQQAIQGTGNDAMASLERYTPQGEGPGLNQSALGSLAQEMARQRGLAAQNSGVFRSYGASEGANANQLATSDLGSFALRGQDALKGIGQSGQLRNQPLNQKVADIKASQGSLLSTALGKLRQQEIGNDIAKTGLLTKEQIAQLQAGTSLANNALTNKTSASNNALTNRTSSANNAATNATSSANNQRTNATSTANTQARIRAGRTGPGGQLSGSKRDAVVNDINTARSVMHNYPGIPPSALSELLTNGYLKVGNQVIKAPRITGGSLGAIVQAAQDLEGGGSLTPGTVTALHQLGFNINGQYPLAKSTAGNVAKGVGSGIRNVVGSIHFG